MRTTVAVLLLAAAVPLFAEEKPVPITTSILLKNRSVEGLKEETIKRGATRVHLHGRFRHALVLSVAPDGSVTIACTDSAERAAALAGVPPPKEE
ncbi:MAG TPA: hypothetical protein VNA04_11300 [Thermoanaerobaculia bacterium]|nr:hypothetical protein [Thermoanaerobaculia bacterium]